MREMICIVCPIGCHLEIDNRQNVTGNRCKRGIDYAIEELTHPTRMVTSTVRLLSVNHPRLSVKTAKPLPKTLIFDLMKALDDVIVRPPVQLHDVVLPNFAETGVDIVATRSIRD